MKKIMICLALASVANASYAIELYKGRVLNHKEWTTGDMKAEFKPANIKDLNRYKTQMNQVNQLKSGNTNYMYLDSGISHITGNVGAPVTIDGYHYIYLTNNTNATKQYNYTFSVCAEGKEHTMQCAYYYDEIELEANGIATVGEQPQVTVVYNKAGSYYTSANTNIYALENGSQVSSYASSTVDIS